MKDRKPLINTGKKEELEAASQRQASSGLCSTCKDAPICTFPRTPLKAVWQCEEFDGYETPAREPAAMSPASKSASRFSPSEKEFSSDRYKGLCTICDDREACIFPKSPEGVWHCEEYS